MKLCWWCCHEISGEILHLPYEFKNGQFKTHGQFCSWECMKAYNKKNGSFRAIDLITLYRKIVYGKIEPIKSAPDRLTLEAFGGKLTIEEFRNGSTSAWIALPNEVFTDTIVHQKPVDGEYILKRDKPLKREKTNIKNALGIGLKK